MHEKQQHHGNIQSRYKTTKGTIQRRYRCDIIWQRANSNTQPEHITHASLFSSEQASFASSNSRAFLRSNAAAKSGSFSAARRCASSSPAKASSCDSAGVSGYDGVVVIDPFEVSVAGVEGVAVLSAASVAAGFVATSCATEAWADGGLGLEATGRATGAVFGLGWDTCCSFCCLTCATSEWSSVNWIACAAGLVRR